jgi:O-6-methylguanine DNA methyltransferase
VASGSVADDCTPDAPELRHDPLLDRAARLLVDYFNGYETSFDLPVEFEGLTDFRTRVLRACAEISWGETRSYREVAAAAGSPGGARAAGQALARNPIPIIVPCHRVIGSDGTLVGFGSGVDAKRRLLDHEKSSVE